MTWIYSLPFCLIIFFTNSPLLSAEYTQKSLSQAYGIEERMHSLPPEVQNLIVKELTDSLWPCFNHVALTKPSLEQQTTLTGQSKLVLFDNETKLASSSPTPDPERIHNLVTWDIATGKYLQSVSYRKSYTTPLDALDNKGIFAIYTGYPNPSTIRMLDMNTLEEISAMDTDGESIDVLTLFDSGKHLMLTSTAQGNGHQIILWNLENNSSRQINDLKWKRGAALSPDETKVAFDNTEGLHLYDITQENPTQLLTYNHRLGQNCTMHFINNEEIIIAYEGIIVVWDLLANQFTKYYSVNAFEVNYFSSQEEAIEIIDAHRVNMYKRLRGLIKGKSRNTSFCISCFYLVPAKNLFIVGVSDGRILIWDIQSGHRIMTLIDPEYKIPVHCIITSDKKKVITTASSWEEWNRPGKYHLCDISDQRARADTMRFWDLPQVLTLKDAPLTLQQAIFMLFLSDQFPEIRSRKDFTKCGKALEQELNEIYDSLTQAQTEFIQLKFF